MSAMKIILKDIPDPVDWILGVRAAKYLWERPDTRDAVMAYGDDERKQFYAKRNKASITVQQIRN